MNISVIGTGYVGLVTGACFAAQGHSVTCADIDADRVASLCRGILPYYEPGLEDLVREGMNKRSLQFTTDTVKAVQETAIIFIAVGTPPSPNGSSDTRGVFQVAETIAQAMFEPKTIVIKSTVPVGTSQAVRSLIADRTRADARRRPVDRGRARCGSSSRGSCGACSP